jgi:hypothetical protein
MLIYHNKSSWLQDRGVFSAGVLRRLWPDLPEAGGTWRMTRYDARRRFRPVDSAFDVNFLPDGSTPVALNTLGITRT